jgi:predicted phage-related endonuclease
MTAMIVQCEQRSEAWFAARAGRLTGSVADAVLATLKSGGEPASRRDLRTQLAIERLTGKPVETDSYVNREMQRGIDLEPMALAAYEAETGLVARKTGFIIRDPLPIGCSLDGDIDDLTGIIELKCPKSATHVGYLKRGAIPSEYVPQITHNLWVTGALWCDFVSFDDRLPAGLQFFRKRVAYTDVDLIGYEKAALKFLEEVADEAEALKALKQ